MSIIINNLEYKNERHACSDLCIDYKDFLFWREHNTLGYKYLVDYPKGYPVELDIHGEVIPNSRVMGLSYKKDNVKDRQKTTVIREKEVTTITTVKEEKVVTTYESEDEDNGLYDLFYDEDEDCAVTTEIKAVNKFSAFWYYFKFSIVSILILTGIVLAILID